ncbi:MAG TPA: ROK family protein [Candidatus Acidoferrum sp.]|nr:ROK family protein [Candidatus Acidoferrum sp.]
MHNVFAGIDVGGTRIKIGLAEVSGRLLSSEIIETASFHDAGSFLESIASQILSMARAASVLVAAVGIGCPGRINFASGRIEWLKSKLEFLEGIPLSHRLGELLGCPVACDNDVNTVLAGEMRYGAGRGFQDVVGITVGTGIGGALVLGGRMVRGRNWATGHFGYISQDPHGPRHVCGNFGVVEEYSSQSGIARELHRAMEAGESSSLAQLVAGGREPDFRDLFLAADAGDAVARRLTKRMISELGLLIANLIYAIDPELILIGGGIVGRRSSLVDELRREAQSRLDYLPAHTTRILPMSLGDAAGVLGGTAMAIDALNHSKEGA